MHDNALCRWTGHQPLTRSYAANGLNQYTAVSGIGYCHDANGNLTADNSYAYAKSNLPAGTINHICSPMAAKS